MWTVATPLPRHQESCFHKCARTPGELLATALLASSQAALGDHRDNQFLFHKHNQEAEDFKERIMKTSRSAMSLRQY